MSAQRLGIACAVSLWLFSPPQTRETGSVELLTTADPPSLESNAGIGLASTSADGRWVLLASSAPNVLPGQVDHNNGTDLFLLDQATGDTVLVTHVPGEPLRAANAPASYGSISANGDSVVFMSYATDLVTGAGNPISYDVYLYDRVSDVVSLVSHIAGAPASSAGQVDPYLGPPRVTADGSLIVYASWAPNIVGGQVDTPYTNDVFLFDRATGLNRLVSHRPGNPVIGGNGGSSNPEMSSDGGLVAFISSATNLAPGQVDFDVRDEIFLWERATDSIALVSHAAGTPAVPANAGPFKFSISANGAVVAFASYGSNHVAGQVDTNTILDVFLYDRSSTEISLVSHTPGAAATAPARGASLYQILSADGRRVVFSSEASNLVSGQVDEPFTLDVFVYDRETGSVSLVNHVAGDPTRASSVQAGMPAVSPDGQVVVFQSTTTDMVAGITDQNGAEDLFLYDCTTSQISLLTHTSGDLAQSGNAGSWSPTFSTDGNIVAFSSAATDLATGDIDLHVGSNAFLLDRGDDTISRVGAIAGAPSTSANGPSFFASAASASDDGRIVVFTSSATNLVPGMLDGNGTSDFFVHDRGTGRTALVTHAVGSPLTTVGTAQDWGRAGSVSGNGSFVVFEATAADLVAGQSDTNDAADVFLYECATGLISLVSHAAGAATTAGNASSGSPVISRDGEYVAFTSDATDLVSGQTKPCSTVSDVYLYERATRSISLVSHSWRGGTLSGCGGSYQPVISTDGARVAFESSATDLVEGQTKGANNWGTDVFLFDRVTRRLWLVSHTPGEEAAGGNMWSQTPSISAAGSIIAFESLATDLVSGQNDSNNRCDMWSCRGSDVFLYDTSSCEVTLVSHVPGAQAVTSEMPSRDPILSADSRYVTFQSPSTDLVVGQLDSNGTDDVFVFDRMNGEVTLASHVPGSPVTAGDKESFLGTLSGNGNAVSFSSRATNLVGGQVDSNGVSDVFLLRRDTGVMSLVSHVPGAQTVTGHGESGPGFLSPDGSVVVFVSTADDLAPLDFNTTLDLFAFAAPSPGRRPRRVIGH